MKQSSKSSGRSSKFSNPWKKRGRRKKKKSNKLAMKGGGWNLK